MKERPVGSLWRPALLLVAVNAFPTLNIWSQNVSRAPELVSLLVLSLATTLLSLALVLLLSKLFRGDAAGAFRLGSIAALVFLGWRQLRLDPSHAEQFAYDAHDLVPLAIGLLLVAVSRVLARAQVFDRVFAAFVGALVATASLTIVIDSARMKPAPLQKAATVSLPGGTRPDIYFILLDGYGRADVLKSLYGYDNEPFERSLEARGYTIAREATANYSMTYASVASALSMDHVMDGDAEVDPAHRVALYRTLGGDNPVVASLQAAGYEYVHLESGWGGTRCGAAVDLCLRAPFLNETSWVFLMRSPLAAPLARHWGHAFTYDALDRLDHFHDLVRKERLSGKPRFTFAHILIPHAPLFLDSRCRTRARDDLAGPTIAASPALLPIRKAAYVEQIRCANSHILQFVDSMPRDSIVMLSSDHGPDSLGQLRTVVEGWNAEAIWERMSIFAAYRFSAKCSDSLPSSITPVNSFRHIFSCAFGAPIPSVDPRYFLVPTEENFPGAQVREIDEIPEGPG